MKKQVSTRERREGAREGQSEMGRGEEGEKQHMKTGVIRLQAKEYPEAKSRI